MALTNTTIQKCNTCGKEYANSYTLEEHNNHDLCDGPLRFYCKVCKKFAPDLVCEACESKARAVEAARLAKEARRRELEALKKALRQAIATAVEGKLTKPVPKKCLSSGTLYATDYLREEHHDEDLCDCELPFFCKSCAARSAGPICGECEAKAVVVQQELVESLARKQREEEKRERERLEKEAQLRREREAQARREKAFAVIAAIPVYVVLTTTLLAFLLSLQLITHGTFVIPYSATMIVASIIIGICATLVVFLMALLFQT